MVQSVGVSRDWAKGEEFLEQPLGLTANPKDFQETLANWRERVISEEESKFVVLSAENARYIHLLLDLRTGKDFHYLPPHSDAVEEWRGFCHQARRRGALCSEALVNMIASGFTVQGGGCVFFRDESICFGRSSGSYGHYLWPWFLCEGHRKKIGYLLQAVLGANRPLRTYGVRGGSELVETFEPSNWFANNWFTEEGTPLYWSDGSEVERL